MDQLGGGGLETLIEIVGTAVGEIVKRVLRWWLMS
jgi:hypothetical protein